MKATYSLINTLHQLTCNPHTEEEAVEEIIRHAIFTGIHYLHNTIQLFYLKNII